MLKIWRELRSPSLRLWLLGLPRGIKKGILLATDILLLPLAVWLAFDLRLGVFWWPNHAYELIPPVVAVVVTLAMFIQRGLYQTVVRYMHASAVNILLTGTTLGTLAFMASTQMAAVQQPRSVPLLFWFIALSLVGGVRLFAQVYLRRFTAGIIEPVIIYGAGSTGSQLGQALSQGLGHCVVAYIDDNPQLPRVLVHGERVHRRDDLPALLKTYQVKQIFLAVPSATRDQRREMLSFLEPWALRVRTLPSMEEVISGRLRIDEVRDVAIDDLLGREPVPPRPDLLEACLRHKTVMVTGAGGSIGAALCREIIRTGPRALVLYEVCEYALYRVHRDLLPLSHACGVTLQVVLGNVQDEPRLLSVLRAHQVQTVYHAAAYKHVPMVEHNVIAGVHNNLYGTRALARAAMQCAVETFVLISTDKAVRPANVMGASKRMAEMVLQDMARQPGMATRFAIVRFGNVLGSSGSVVPLFMEQIRSGGPVTVTHPEVIRYFMTIPEAAQLVIQAGALASGGEIFLLDMGVPVRIADLARKMIHLSGLRVRDTSAPEGDIEIHYTGLRPGEKLFEELLISGDVAGTVHPRILRAQETVVASRELEQALQRVEALIRQGDETALARHVIAFAQGQHEPQPPHNVIVLGSRLLEGGTL